jgi:hypothetical protein
VSWYTWAWIGFGLYFAVVEGIAIYRSWRHRRRGEASGTLSAHLWMLFGTTRGTKATAGAWVRRGVLALALLWLVLHLGSGGQII